MPSIGKSRWFDLTPDERRALIVIITLFLIGLITWSRLRQRQRADRIDMDGNYVQQPSLALASDP